MRTKMNKVPLFVGLILLVLAVLLAQALARLPLTQIATGKPETAVYNA
jgi:hypothetical protein